MEKRYLTVRDLAQRFQLQPDSIYRSIRRGRLPATVVARLGGSIRIDEAAFERELAAGTLATRTRRAPAAPVLQPVA